LKRTEPAASGHPQVGMLVSVRNRRVIVTSVEPYDGKDGLLHLVHLEYTDFDGLPEECILWERERGASAIPQSALPRLSETPPMPGADFDALVQVVGGEGGGPLQLDIFDSHGG